MSIDYSDPLKSVRLLTVEDLVDLKIGSRASVYRMLARGDIPCIRRGRSVRVRQVDLEAWLEAGGSSANVLPFRKRKAAKRSA